MACKRTRILNCKNGTHNRQLPDLAKRKDQLAVPKIEEVLTEDTWITIKEQLRKELELTDISYLTWIEPLCLFHNTKNDLIVGIYCDDPFAIRYIGDKYWKKIENVIRIYVGKKPEIKLVMIREHEDLNLQTTITLTD